MKVKHASVVDEDRHHRPLPPTHMLSRLNSDFSFNNDDLDLEAHLFKPDAIHRSVSRESWYKQTLSIVVVGASGDLAKKKTYPSLLSLFQDNLLPKDVCIWGYARSPKTHQELRDHLYPHLIKTGSPEVVVQDFLAKCFYHSGSSYGDENAYMEMMGHIQSYEHLTSSSACNRLFYLAIPPNVFGETGVTIKKVAMSVTGWTRVVIEKPFGRDLKSCQELLEQLAGQFDEGHLYRIDHYLGKEVVQNLSLFRFGNSWLEWLWHRDAIQSVLLTFKEPFGTEGRGGYFDHYGIIRDILQNHLLQVLTLVAMEPPTGCSGDSMRDAKTNVLNAIQPIDLEKDVRLGQYEGYADDETIKNKDTNCPTYAAIRCWIDTPRWKGVPFIMQAGKAMDDGVCEVRIRFRAPSSTIHAIRPPSRQALETNELVMRLQPNPVLEMKTNIKTPGLSGIPMPAKLSMSYNELIEGPDAVGNNPDAYTRLLLDVLRGRNGSFVRDDELHRSWEIFTPLLHLIEQENVRPESYQYGSEGPSGIPKWLEEKMLESSNPTALPQAAL